MRRKKRQGGDAPPTLPRTIWYSAGTAAGSNGFVGAAQAVVAEPDGVIVADFSGVPPGACWGCRRRFAHNESPIWGGWGADGFARLGSCCSGALEVIVVRELRRPQ